MKNSEFTGNDADCGQQGGGRAVIYIENSYIDMDNLDIKDNSYGILMKLPAPHQLSNRRKMQRC